MPSMRFGQGYPAHGHGLATGQAMASGGLVPLPHMNRPKGFSAAIRPPSGLIRSDVPGRTDQHVMKVRPDSYVVPADVVSGLGQGNTLAGAKLLEQALKSGPYGVAPKKPRVKRLAVPRPGSVPHFAEGGEVEPADDTEIITAGGEFVLDPDMVKEIGGGDVKEGHRRIDAMVKTVRAQIIAHMKKLPGPQR